MVYRACRTDGLVSEQLQEPRRRRHDRPATVTDAVLITLRQLGRRMPAGHQEDRVVAETTSAPTLKGDRPFDRAFEDLYGGAGLAG